MPQEIKERITQHLRPRLENVASLSQEEIEAIIGAFTVLESSAPHTRHLQYRLARLQPEIEQSSEVQHAISLAVQEAGYYVAGEE